MRLPADRQGVRITEFGSRSGVGTKQIIDFISQCLEKRGHFFGLEH